jgi:hypothetical protein
MIDYTIREINRYLKKDIQLSSSIANCDIKQTLLEKYRYQAWDKAGCKTHYNFYVLNKLSRPSNGLHYALELFCLGLHRKCLST